MIEIKPKKNVTILVGTRFPAKIDGVPPVGYKPDPKKTIPCVVNHHDTVVDVLKTLALPTDGSMLLLYPGVLEPFELDDLPYADLKEGYKYEIVPNRPDQVGPFAVEADKVNAEGFASSLLPAIAVPVVLEPVADLNYPKLLSDGTPQGRPDVLVGNSIEEEKARGEGFTVEVPDPKP